MKNPFEVLGLEEGADAKAIRRAYARKLREVHPEDDPEHFKQVRAAYEALTEGHWRPYQPAMPPLEEPPPATVAVEPDAAQGPWGAAGGEVQTARQRVAGRLDKIEELLRTGKPSARQDARFALDQLLQDPALEEIDLRAGIEHEVAAIIVRNLPHSDSLIMRAHDAFRWGQEEPADPAIARVLDRLDEWNLIASLEAGHDPLSPAWKILTGKLPRWLRPYHARTAKRDGIADLLDYCRFVYPGLRYSLDANEMSWWDEELAKDRVRVSAVVARLLAGFGLVFLLNAWGDSGDRRWLWAGLLVAFLFADLALQRFLVPRIERYTPDRWPSAALALGGLTLPIIVALLPATWAAGSLIWALTLGLLWGLRWATASQSGVPPDRFTTTLLGLGATAFLLMGSKQMGLEKLAMLVAVGWLLIANLPKLRPMLGVAFDRITNDRGSFLLAAIAAAYLAFGWFGASDHLGKVVSVFAVIAALGISHFTYRALLPLVVALGLVGANLLMVSMLGDRDGANARIGTAGDAIVETRLSESSDLGRMPLDAHALMREMQASNPEFYGQVDALLAELDNDKSRWWVADRIDEIVQDEAMRLMPLTSNQQVHAYLAMRLDVLREDLGRSSASCATGGLEIDGKMPHELRQEWIRQTLRLVAAGPVDEAERQDAELPEASEFLAKREEVFEALLAAHPTPSSPAGAPTNYAQTYRNCVEQAAELDVMIGLGPDQAATIYRMQRAARDAQD
ncbi:J domain-containing protein [Sphingomicrobium flavum]|uniref:J domain-containing protein n=1 Tax=Sphingomicrobium flavum TaxID=1229164 RepID=UPI0021ADE112|nr:DnaJ domain-containing protein [Sphingomicrobium flavum]